MTCSLITRMIMFARTCCLWKIINFAVVTPSHITSHHSIIIYFPITAGPFMFFFNLNYILHSNFIFTFLSVNLLMSKNRLLFLWAVVTLDFHVPQSDIIRKWN